MQNSEVYISYDYFNNGVQQAQCNDAILDCLHLLPFWVKEIQVQRYDNAPEEGVALTVMCHPEYRGIRIQVYYGYFDYKAIDQKRMMLHEIIHALLAPITGFVLDTMIPGFKEPMQSFLAKEFTARMESVVQDMSFTLRPVL